MSKWRRFVYFARRADGTGPIGDVPARPENGEMAAAAQAGGGGAKAGSSHETHRSVSVLSRVSGGSL